ncbi:hypothetical protein [Litorisediminicola beolgyonensis]|uniref:Uncharacterized protein n=1 Tax=Litorisediminicola beolgyonensis TaxID=1173614 RepID=A0ABW3ZKX6_9RHOB
MLGNIFIGICFVIGIYILWMVWSGASISSLGGDGGGSGGGGIVEGTKSFGRAIGCAFGGC